MTAVSLKDGEDSPPVFCTMHTGEYLGGGFLVAALEATLMRTIEWYATDLRWLLGAPSVTSTMLLLPSTYSLSFIIGVDAGYNKLASMFFLCHHRLIRLTLVHLLSYNLYKDDQNSQQTRRTTLNKHASSQTVLP